MEYNGREWMMKKIILIFSVVIIGVGLCGFRPRVQKLTPNNNICTPFPQTGVIKVYKYNMFKKEEIGELKWSQPQKGNIIRRRMITILK